jgi:hypothetical protein
MVSSLGKSGKSWFLQISSEENNRESQEKRIDNWFYGENWELMYPDVS